MSLEPFLWATFCDDVRQEVGNKLSYLGIYGPNLIVRAFPTTLVKLCCVLSVRVPPRSLPKHVVFRLMRDDEVLYEADVTPAEIMGATQQDSADAADSKALTIASIAQLIAFPVTQRCLLTARALLDGKELRGGALELIAADAVH